MNIFNQSEDDIIFGLIKRDNPGLVPELTPQNCYISTAVPNTDSDKDLYNTVAIVIPRHNSGLYNRTPIKYNRIDLADLFRGHPHVKVSGFSAVEAYATRDEIPEMLGLTYGLPIRPGDVSDVSTLNFYAPPHADYGKGIYVIANNKCFIGQIYVGFSRDFEEALQTVFKPPVLDALRLPAGIANLPTHDDWPATWGFFGDLDFTEIAATVNHTADFNLTQATAIGQFMGRTFFDPVTAYNPVVDYNQSNPFGWLKAWNKHVALGKTTALKSQYPWLNTKYTHVKITKMANDPSTGLPVAGDYYFAFYFNWKDEA